MFKKLLGGAKASTTRTGVSGNWWQWPAFVQAGELYVVGESNYQDALAAAVERNGRTVMAELVAEPSNKYDRRAIRVDVDGQTVGYVPKAETDRWHPVLAQLSGRPATARATIGGGGSGYFFGIVVLASPSILDQRRGFLYGSRQVVLQVPKDGVDALAAQVPQGGCPADLSLDGETVVVDVGGVRVGKLTKQSSSNFLQLVRLTRAMGFGAGCWLTTTVKPDGSPKFNLNLVEDLDNWDVARGNIPADDKPVEVEAVTTSATPAEWHPDPTGRHELRYWDGSAWTAHVANDGVTSSDPL
jgi:hypothetical protein